MARWSPLVTVVLCAVAAWLPADAGAQVMPGAVVTVLPFENPQAAARFHWLREGVAVLVGEALDSGDIEVVAREQRVLAYDRLQFPPLAILSRASSIKVGQAVAATAVVVGRVEAEGADLVLTARMIRLDSGRLLPEVSQRGPVTDLFAMAGRLAAALASYPALPSGWVPPPSPAAFELYVKGLMADTPEAERRFFEQALAAAPGYDAVRLALWQANTEQNLHQRALDSVTPIGPGRPAYRDARFRAGLSLIRLRRDDEAFSVLRELQQQRAQAAVANALGVVQLRRGGTPQTGRATYYFNQATELEPGDGDYFFNLGYAYWLDKDANGAAYWLREAVRRNPADGDAHFLLGSALQQMGASTEATRERELARRLSSRYAGWEARAAGGGEVVPRGLERLHERLEATTARVDAVVTAAGQRDQAALARFYLDAGRRAFDREADREAVQELRRALYLSPYLADAHLLLGRIHLRAGRAADAVQTLKIAIWSEESAAGHLALAEALAQTDDLPAARTAVERALALEPGSAEARALKARLGPAR
jgi:tetratricopeptide (TPR) repeat protein/TolB-like protein